MLRFITISAIECFALIVLKCEYTATACTKSTVSYFLVMAGVELIKKQEAMHFQRGADTYIQYSAQVAAFDPTAKHDC